MTVQIIYRIAIAFLISATTISGDLRGDSSSICRRTVSRRESRYVPYAETYKQKLWGSSFRIRTRTNFKAEYHVMYTTEAVCCDGYENDDGTCKPVCAEPCNNGKCIRPDLCECNSGYLHDFFGQCKPVCAVSCNFGQCTAPETCTCEDGYKITTHKYTCEPVCSSGCEHGYCSEPDSCTCDSGYERNDNNECDPICERPCVNGKCVAPDVCTCDNGFQQSEDDVFACEPICSKPCVFGSCTEPETCTCNEGYEMSSESNFTCNPICNETCVFASCIAPDTCSCNDGYGITSESQYVCKPHCEMDCINGNCVKPNVCECLDGYVKSMEIVANSSKCEPHCDDDSCNNGVCTAPNTCTCRSGYWYNSTTSKCDPVCTESCVNGFCESPETCMCTEGYIKSSANSNTCEAVCESCVNGFCEAPNICVCNEGFVKDEIDNKTCVASCKPECQNGVCSAMGCSCDFGWDGNSCEASLLCFISKTIEDSSVQAESEHGELNRSRMDSLSKLDRPECNQRCLAKVNSDTINKTLNKEIRYFLPVDSPCNIALARDIQSTSQSHSHMTSKASVSVIGAVVGTVLCAMVVCSVYLIYARMIRNKKMEINSTSRECIYKDDPEDHSASNFCSIENIHSS